MSFFARKNDFQRGPEPPVDPPQNHRRAVPQTATKRCLTSWGGVPQTAAVDAEDVNTIMTGIYGMNGVELAGAAACGLKSDRGGLGRGRSGTVGLEDGRCGCDR